MISVVILKILTPLQKLHKNVRDLGKLIVAKGFEKSTKSRNLVTLIPAPDTGWTFFTLVSPKFFFKKDQK